MWGVPEEEHLSVYSHLHRHVCANAFAHVLHIPSDDMHTWAGGTWNCPSMNCGGPQYCLAPASVVLSPEVSRQKSAQTFPQTPHPATAQTNQMCPPRFPRSSIIKGLGVTLPQSHCLSVHFLHPCCPAVALTFRDTGTSRLQKPWSRPRKHSYLNLPLSSVPVGRKYFFFLNQPYINKLNSTSLG